MEEPEIWKRIENHPLYEISNKGRVRSYIYIFSVPKILSTKTKERYDNTDNMAALEKAF